MYLQTLGKKLKDFSPQNIKPKLRRLDRLILIYLQLEGTQSEENILDTFFYKNGVEDDDAKQYWRTSKSALQRHNSIEITEDALIQSTESVQSDVIEFLDSVSFGEFEKAFTLYESPEQTFLNISKDKLHPNVDTWITNKQIEIALCAVNVYMTLAEGINNKDKSFELCQSAYTLMYGLIKNFAASLDLDDEPLDIYVLEDKNDQAKIQDITNRIKKIIELHQIENTTLQDDISNLVDGEISKPILFYILGHKRFDASSDLYFGRKNQLNEGVCKLHDKDTKIIQVVGRPLEGKSRFAQHLVELYYSRFRYNARFKYAIFTDLENNDFSKFHDFLSYIIDVLPEDTLSKEEQDILFITATSDVTQALRQLLRLLNAKGGALFVFDGFEKILQNEEAHFLSNSFLDVVLTNEGNSKAIVASREDIQLETDLLTTIKLENGLAERDFIDLFQSIFSSSTKLPISETEVFVASNGIPQVVYQLARAWEADFDLWAMEEEEFTNYIESIARAPSEALFNSLSLEEKNILKFCAIFSSQIKDVLLRKFLSQIFNVTNNNIDKLLDALISRQFIQRSDKRWIFLHDLYRQVILEHIHPTKKTEILQNTAGLYLKEYQNRSEVTETNDLRFDIRLVELLVQDNQSKAAIDVFHTFAIADLVRLGQNKLVVGNTQRMLRKFTEPVSKARACNIAGVALQNLGHFEQSQKYYKQGIEILSSVDNHEATSMTGTLKLNFSILLFLLGQLDESLNAIRHTLKLWYGLLRDKSYEPNPIDDWLFFEGRETHGYCVLGDTFLALKDFSRAKKSYEYGCKIYQKYLDSELYIGTIDKHFEAFRQLGLAKVAILEGETEKAESFLEVAQKMATENADDRVSIDYHLSYADLYDLQKASKTSQAHLSQAQLLAQKENDPFSESIALLRLQAYGVVTSDYQQRLDYLKDNASGIYELVANKLQ